MAKYDNMNSWDEFESEMKTIGNFSKRLAEYIDYVLWKGGQYNDMVIQIEKKARELGHGGYRFPGKVFSERTGNIEDRSFLGHIAIRAKDSRFIVEVDNIVIDNNTIDERSFDEKMQMNAIIAIKVSKNAFIRIEGFKGERRK